jgi:hypothetical protein
MYICIMKIIKFKAFTNWDLWLFFGDLIHHSAILKELKIPHGFLRIQSFPFLITLIGIFVLFLNPWTKIFLMYI